MDQLRRLSGRLLLGLFSPNHTGFLTVAMILMVLETFLSYYIIQKVPYTEIDWSTYMQQVDCYVRKGISNYSRIGGDTGPVVYPAGHIWTYRILHLFTNSGKNIRLAQHIFQVLYLVNLFFVFRILYKTVRIPPVVLFLVTVTGYRIHSIFVLRLFNDPVAMLLFYIAMDLFLEEKWLIGCVFYSLAVSIKMNVLLFAPALFVTLLINTTISHTMGYILMCGIIQLYVGSPFLLYDWKSYVTRSFDLGRVFMFKWTVNWRFLPEELFLDKRFHVSLLVGHLTFLAVFAWFMWYRRGNGLFASVSLSVFRGIPTITGPVDTLYAFYTSNLIGIAFSRSLHYQFYSWYFHQLPFLLFCNYPHVGNVSDIPWFQFFWKVPLLLAIELSWNVYPSTWWSSLLLHICHFVILTYLIRTRPMKPQDLVTPGTIRMLKNRQGDVNECYEQHGTVMPPMSNHVPTAEEIQEKRRKIAENPQPLYKSRLESNVMFARWYENERKSMRDEFQIYYGADGKKECLGLPPLDDRSKLKFHEKVKLMYAEALELQAKYNNPKELHTSDNGEVMNGGLPNGKVLQELLKDYMEQLESEEEVEDVKNSEDNQKTSVRKRRGLPRKE